MLVGEDRGWDEDGDLATALHGLERGAHGDLGLAIADVTDEQAVHRARAFHVLLDVDRGTALVGRVLEEEARFELALPRAIGRVGGAAGDLATRVEIEQLDRHLLDRGARLVALLRPALAAQPVQPRRGRVGVALAGGTVALYLVEPI